MEDGLSPEGGCQREDDRHQGDDHYREDGYCRGDDRYRAGACCPEAGYCRADGYYQEGGRWQVVGCCRVDGRPESMADWPAGAGSGAVVRAGAAPEDEGVPALLPKGLS